MNRRGLPRISYDTMGYMSETVKQLDPETESRLRQLEVSIPDYLVDKSGSIVYLIDAVIEGERGKLSRVSGQEKEALMRKITDLRNLRTNLETELGVTSAAQELSQAFAEDQNQKDSHIRRMVQDTLMWDHRRDTNEVDSDLETLIYEYIETGFAQSAREVLAREIALRNSMSLDMYIERCKNDLESDYFSANDKNALRQRLKLAESLKSGTSA